MGWWFGQVGSAADAGPWAVLQVCVDRWSRLELPGCAGGGRCFGAVRERAKQRYALCSCCHALCAEGPPACCPPSCFFLPLSSLGFVSNAHPSEVLPLSWPEPDLAALAGLPAPPPGFAQVGVSLEPLAELAAKEGSKLGAKEVRMEALQRAVFACVAAGQSLPASRRRLPAAQTHTGRCCRPFCRRTL